MAQPYDPHCYTCHVCHGTGQVISIDNARLLFLVNRVLGLNVARMGRRGMYSVLLGERKKIYHYEDTGVDRRIILKWMLKKWGGKA